jgi:NAD(P)-dependent dehydrogenase (short-subunit alcohol dehydrogenase family)
MKLKGKAAIITGATSGIGEASAVLFAREGARVTVVGRSNNGPAIVQRIQAAGGEAQFVRADVAEAAGIEQVFASHMSKYQRLDILFNNASYEGPGTSIGETSDEEFDKVIATNLKSVFRACKRAAPIMIAAGSGSIINTSAGSAREGLAWPNLSAYISSKGGVISLTRALAVEFAPHIRVNSLNPGLIDTPMLRSFTNKQADPTAFWAGLNQVQLLKRIGTADEAARAALFLASDDSSYVTGTDLLVDGGLVLG